MKKIYNILITTALACILFVNLTHAANYSYSCAFNSTSGFNSRTGQETNYHCANILPSGSIVWSDRNYRNGWYQIKAGCHDELWINSNYVIPARYNGCLLKIRTNGENLSMHSGPGTKFTTISSIPNGTSVPSYYRGDGWAYVIYGCNCGWISMNYTS